MPETVSENVPENPTHSHIIALLLEHRADTIERLAVGEKRMSNIEAELVMNTEITRQIRDAVTTTRMVSNFLRWAAGILAAVAAVWVAVKTLAGEITP